MKIWLQVSNFTPKIRLQVHTNTNFHFLLKKNQLDPNNLIHVRMNYSRISSNFGAKIQTCLKVKFCQTLIFGQKLDFYWYK